MKPLHAATLDAMAAVIRRFYLRPVTLQPVEGDPGRWDILMPWGRNKHTHVVERDGRYTFELQPVKASPNWDREIPNEWANEKQRADEDEDLK